MWVASLVLELVLFLAVFYPKQPGIEELIHQGL